MGKRPCSTSVRFSRGAAAVSVIVSQCAYAARQTALTERSMTRCRGATSSRRDRQIRLGVVSQLCGGPIAVTELRHDRVGKHDVSWPGRVVEDAECMPQLMRYRQIHTLVQ